MRLTTLIFATDAVTPRRRLVVACAILFYRGEDAARDEFELARNVRS